jgi:hypothetical protein
MMRDPAALRQDERRRRTLLSERRVEMLHGTVMAVYA